jgi:hypothetical protein
MELIISFLAVRLPFRNWLSPNYFTTNMVFGDGCFIPYHQRPPTGWSFLHKAPFCPRSTRYPIDIYRSSLECVISQEYPVNIYWTVMISGLTLPNIETKRNYITLGTSGDSIKKIKNLRSSIPVHIRRLNPNL